MVLLALPLALAVNASAPPQPSDTLRAVLLEQLQTTHNKKEWFAPAMTAVLLAMIPTGRPSIRARAVTISGAKRSRRNVADPSSARVSMTGATSYARRSRSGT